MKKYIFIYLFTLAALIPFATALGQTQKPLPFYLSSQVELASPSLQYSIDNFVSGLDEMKAPTRYIKEALNALSGIGFKTFPEGILASYNSVTNWIYLSEGLKDPTTGRLKDIDDLNQEEIATIYHELFHCYLHKISIARNDEFSKLFRTRSTRTYPNHQFDFQNEAYAAFIDTTLNSYIQIRRLMEKMSPEKREKMRSQAGGLSSIFEGTFNEALYGYYRSWNGQFITTTVDLPKEDRSIIIRYIYDEELTADFKKAFSEENF